MDEFFACGLGDQTVLFKLHIGCACIAWPPFPVPFPPPPSFSPGPLLWPFRGCLCGPKRPQAAPWGPQRAPNVPSARRLSWEADWTQWALATGAVRHQWGPALWVAGGPSGPLGASPAPFRAAELAPKHGACRGFGVHTVWVRWHSLGGPTAHGGGQTGPSVLGMLHSATPLPDARRHCGLVGAAGKQGPPWDPDWVRYPDPLMQLGDRARYPSRYLTPAYIPARTGCHQGA